MLIAVYGSLRKGLSNHKVIENTKYIGQYETKPIYNMYSLNAFPGITEGGNTSIVMEVYRVNKEELQRVDNLEGYDSSSNDNDFYKRVVIKTPYGAAFTYLFEGDVEGLSKVKDGDWTKYKKFNNLKEIIGQC